MIRMFLLLLFGLFGFNHSQGFPFYRPGWGRFGHPIFGPVPPPIPPPIGPPLPPTIPGPLNIVAVPEVVEQYDILYDFQNIKKNHKALKQNDWKKKVKKFCHRFPGHPSCRKGRVPDQKDLDEMINNFDIGKIGKYLKKVPRIYIDNPLNHVDQRLKSFVNEYQNFGYFNKETVTRIKSVCKKKKCKEQPTNAKKSREIISTRMTSFEKRLTGEDHSDVVNLRLDRTLQLKEALLEKSNLAQDIIPADNGIYDLDTLLTEEQANILLNELNKAGEGSDEIPIDEAPSALTKKPNPSAKRGKNRRPREKKSALYFENDFIKKWPTNQPISYVLDESLDELDKNDVRQAVNDIQSSTCIRFREVATPPNGSHIIYYKIESPTFCGLSYVGRTEPANPIYMSFQCANSRGIAIHETMHALGVAHQHLRFDRDQFIDVNWNNIDPQQYDAFVVVDSKLYTSYGVKYSYDSIMHYNAYTAAQNYNEATMIPKTNPQQNLNLLGQRDRMSKEDIELLNKMYCMNGCDDKNVYCGAWALRDLCTHPNHDRYMKSNCPKSCNLCARG